MTAAPPPGDAVPASPVPPVSTAPPASTVLPAGRLLLNAPRRGKPPRHLADLTLAERMAAVAGLGEKAFRGRQLSVHYFERLAALDLASAGQLTDLPAASRERLITELFPPLLTPVRELAADGGATVKTLWRLFDGALVESVLMRYRDRATVCISSQAGCGMNCPFCATGQAGLTRNLSAAEIVDQVRQAARTMALASGTAPDVHGEPLGEQADDAVGPDDQPGSGAPAGRPAGRPGGSAAGRAAGRDTARTTGPHRVNNVVFMGMGEALANYRAAVTAIRRITEPSPDGLGISARGVTMSTVGLVPAIDKLSGEGLPVTLALSLHAPDDELRNELVPINTRWTVAEALDAARRYFEVTGRRVSIEYALIRDINDQAWRADRLGVELNRRGRGWVHVNPIPLNPTPGSRWTASDPRVEREFVETLRARGVPTTVRDTRGRDIDGACGQLAATV